MSIVSLTGFSQLAEDFEATTYPPAGWIVFDNGIGTSQSWFRSGLTVFNYNNSAGTARISRETFINGAGEDWLVTNQVTVPTDGQLRFFSRKLAGADYLTEYTIRISTVSQNNPSDFTVLQTWNDATINSDQFNPVYEQKVVDLSAYVGSDVYIAFVKRNENGNHWLVDNVYVDQRCAEVTSQWVTGVSDTSVNLNWDNPSGATQWEVEWGPTGFTQGTGTLVTTTNNPYPLTGLVAATTYDFYVRPICPNDNYGDWFGPETFTTALCPIAAQCDFNFILSDDWGDGWSGNSMTISQFGQPIATITLSNTGPTNGDGPETFSVPLCSGEPFTVFWNAGTWPGDVIMEIQDPSGVPIFNLPANSNSQAGTMIYSGPASCTPPTCPRPSDVIVSNLTTTSGTVTWVDNTSGNATEWQVIIQPAGSGYPINGSEIINETVFSTTYNFSGLNSATAYEVFVLAVCDASTVPDPSLYEGPEPFYTLIENDECVNALVAPVNDNTSCLNTVHGSIIGATASSDPNTCGGTDDDDVWFQFTAINTTHSIALNNVTGSTTDLFHVLYSGSCGTLTQLYCSEPNNSVATGLTPGQTYFVRVYSSTSTPGQTSEFDLCIGIPPSCDNSLAFCGDTGYTYPNSTNVPSYGSIDCLFTTPNPAWFYMQVSQSGSLNFQIAQTNTAGNGLDVDFVCWGPFTIAEYQSTMCSSLYDFPDGNTSIPDNAVACSYSTAAIENFTIPNAQAGDIYVVLITNFSGQVGTITFNQTGGTGTTNCDIVCSLDLGPDQTLCADSFEIVASATSADSYQWYLDDVLIPGATASTFTAVQSGTYKCVIECDINEIEDTIEIELNSSDVPTFTNPGPLCSGSPNVTLDTTDTNGITGSWTLGGNPVTEVDASVAGIYDYVFTPDATAFPCAPVITMQVEILATCTFNAFASAVYLDNCETTDPGEYFNTTGSAINAFGATANAFNGNLFGTYVQNSGNFMLQGAAIKTFKNATSNVCAANMYYRVYEASSVPGAFTPIALSFIEDCGGGGTFTSTAPCVPGDQIWGDSSQSIDLTTFAPGDYIVEVYYELIGDIDSAVDCDGDIVLLNNSGNNYTAQFSIQDSITFTWQDEQCDSNNAFITFSGFNAGEVYSVTYNDDSVLVGPVNYTANTSGEILIVGLDAGTYDNFNFVINGCSILQSTPVIITDFSPSITSVTNNSDICYGNDAVFEITGTPDYNVDYTINGVAMPQITLDASGFATITIPTPAAGSVDLALVSISSGSCNIDVSSFTSSVLVNALPTATVVAQNSTVCYLDADGDPVTPGFGTAVFEISGTPNAEVTYSTDGGSNTQVIVLDASGNATVSVVSENNVEIILTNINNPSTGCSNTLTGILANVAVVFVPTPTIDQNITSYCLSSTDDPNTPEDETVTTIEVTSPLFSLVNTPGDLFISEVTDAQVPFPGTYLSYIEIYNGTGVPVDLSNYRLIVYLNGATTTPAANDNLLSGILANDDVVVIKISNSADEGGVVPDLTFPLTAGVNNNDRIVLASATGTEIDTWGTMDNSAFTPGSSQGYNFQRITTGTTLPTNTFDLNDWVVTDWISPTSTNGDYSDVGSYSLYASNYEYILSDGTNTTSQTTTTFTNVGPGNYTLTVYDSAANCYSPYPLEITINQKETVSLVDLEDCRNSTLSFPTFDVYVYDAFGNHLLDTNDQFITAPAVGTWTNSNGNTVTTIDTSVSGLFTYTFTPVSFDSTSGYYYCVENVELDVNVLEGLEVTFSDIEVCNGADVDFPTVSNEGYQLTGTWTPNVISTSTIGSTDYTFVPDDSCYDSAIFTVITESCTIQKGISPNGDGSNDYFDLTAYDVKQLEIFNRHGRKVYSKSNYVNEWYGQSDKGNDLPTGTYYFVIEFNDLPTKTGWIYINREE